jgi:hypothetical protein
LETVGEQKVFGFVGGATKIRALSCTAIRKADAHHVRSYVELARKVAELQFMNRDFVLLFRGQNTDHRNRQNNTSLKPSIFRPPPGQSYATDQVLLQRFTRLKAAEGALVRRYKHDGLVAFSRVERQRILRWAILQHYLICPTPLLDVTHSLRIAASFVSRDLGYLFVLAVPHISGAITASAEAGIQIVRLASVCPPSALRPHIQEGYLLGEYPEIATYDQKVLFDHYETDFGLRLVSKFSFSPGELWRDSTFQKVPEDALYPAKCDDPLSKLAKTLNARSDYWRKPDPPLPTPSPKRKRRRPLKRRAH